MTDGQRLNILTSELLRKVEDVCNAIPDHNIPAAQTCRGVLLGVQLGIKMLRDEYHRNKDRELCAVKDSK